MLMRGLKLASSTLCCSLAMAEQQGRGQVCQMGQLLVHGLLLGPQLHLPVLQQSAMALKPEM